MYKQQQSSLKVRPFNHLSSACQAVLYFDWLSFACLHTLRIQSCLAHTIEATKWTDRGIIKSVTYVPIFSFVEISYLLIFLGFFFKNKLMIPF